MVATIARSMPRPITTSPMPSPKIPRIETLRTSAIRLPGEKIVQRERENDEQERCEGEDDAFLRNSQFAEI
jgi:hypothetical protein